MPQRGLRARRVLRQQLQARRVHQLGARAGQVQHLGGCQPGLERRRPAFGPHDASFARSREVAAVIRQGIEHGARVRDAPEREQQVDLLVREPGIGGVELARLVDPAQRFGGVAARAFDPRGRQRPPHVGGVEFACSLAGGDGQVQLVHVHQLHAAEHMRDEIERIESRRGGVMRQRVPGLAAAVVPVAHVTMQRGVVGIPLDRPLQQRQRLFGPGLLGEQPPAHRQHMRRVGTDLRGAVDQRFGFGFHVLERHAVHRQAVQQ